MKKFLFGFLTVITFGLVLIYIYYQARIVGSKLAETHIYLEYTFYGALAIIVYALILHPIITILMAPYYSIADYCDENYNKGNFGITHRAKRLLKCGQLTDATKLELKKAIKDHKYLPERMYIIYNNDIKQNIDKLVYTSARDLLFMTAISQSSFMDSMMVLINNFRMIKKIIILCGFRPTFIRTCKLFINVFLTSLVADGMQKVQITSLLGLTVKGPIKYITDSTANGLTNAFLMLRIGMLTKQYLYAKDAKKQRFSLKTIATVEAVKLVPSLLSSLITGPLSGLVSFFKGNAPLKEGEEEETFTEEENKEFETKVDWKWKMK